MQDTGGLPGLTAFVMPSQNRADSSGGQSPQPSSLLQLGGMTDPHFFILPLGGFCTSFVRALLWRLGVII